MITQKDVLSFGITREELEYCRQHPDPGCYSVSTGQLRTLGNIALMKALGLGWEEFEEQLDRARQIGTSFAFEARNGKVAGICPSVSVIRDKAVLRKFVIVPANQMRKNPWLQSQYAVGVFVVGETNEQKEPVAVESVEVAGWVSMRELAERWSGKEGGAPFHVKNSAVAPCVALSPMQMLLGQVQATKYCV